MKTGIKLKDQWRKALFLKFGGCAQLAKECKISATTAAKVLDGGRISHNIRQIVWKTITEKIDKSISAEEMFEITES